MIIPYISREDVRNALSSLIYSSRNLEANGLRHLLLVDLRVTDPAMPSGDGVRDYAVRELLVSEITHAFAEHRAVFLLAPPSERASIDVVRQEIAEAVERGAFKLNVWSLLYYRYVRADLALSAEELAQALSIHPRTISRYNDEGVELLKERLIIAEYKARQAQARRRLYAALPYSMTVHLVGRTKLLQSVRQMLVTLSPRHILVTGPVGIGKTTFVQEILRQQIDSDSLDQLVWIEQPESVDYMRQRITEALLREDGVISLRDYLLLYRVAFVFDGIAHIMAELPTFEQFLGELSASVVFLINPIYLPLVGISAHIVLPEIDLDAASTLLEELIPENDPSYKQELTQTLYERLGGNPLALRLAVGLWDDESWNGIQGELNDRLFSRLFESLEPSVQRVWCVLALFSQNVLPELLASVWAISLDDIEVLRRYTLVDADHGAYRLISAARDYIRRQYVHMQEVRGLFDILIDQMEEDGSVLEVVEQALATGFPEVDFERRRRWLYASWQEGLRRNHWALWRAILETYHQESGNFDPSLYIAYSICLRRLGNSAEAEQAFEKVVNETGRLGQFEAQASALLEWNVLAKQQGEYERAYAYLQQAKRFVQRAHDDDLLLKLTLQESEILIQQNKAVEGYELLIHFSQNGSVLALESEAQFVLGNYEYCRHLAVQALKLVEGDRVTEASLYTIIGRSFGEQGDQEKMQQYLTNAVMLFERLDDVFSLARAETNLAASLIQTHRFVDAERLLIRAERVQTRLEDKVGLTATLHNRRILARHIPR